MLKKKPVKDVQTPIKGGISQKTSKMNNIQQNIMGQRDIEQDDPEQHNPARKNIQINETPTRIQTQANPQTSTTKPQKDFNNEHDDFYSDDRSYNDINEGINLSSPNKNVEEKYEKYLDDLYFNEEPDSDRNNMTKSPKGLSLAEQLVMDEIAHSSITKDPYVPEVEEELEIPHKTPKKFEDISENSNKSVPTMINLRNKDSTENEKIDEDENSAYNPYSLHGQSIHYKKKEKSSSTTERILAIVLVVLIILVVIYLIYLFTLHYNILTF